MPANEPKQSLPEIDFATFVLSLASNALVASCSWGEPNAPRRSCSRQGSVGCAL